MAYIGRSVDIGMFEKQVLTPDSSTTTFTLTYAVGSANSLLVVYGGVVQEPQVAYSVSGGGQSIAFSEAPATGTTTYIIYLGKQLTTPRAAGQETTKQTFAGNGSTVTFTLTDPPVVPAGIMVFVDGILQREGSGNNYVSSGSTITFSSAPDSSAEIDVYTLVKEKVSIDTVADGSITVAKLAAGHPTWNGAGETVIASASTGNSLRITNTGSGNSLLVEDSASTDASPFVVDATGNVGIGTSSPAYKLDVKGNIRSGLASTTTGEIAFFSASNDSQMGMLNNATEFKIYSTYATTAGYKPINFYTSDALKMTLDAAGNVGIGTSSPAALLHVGTLNGTGSLNGYTKVAIEATDYAVTTLKSPAANFSQIIFTDTTTTSLGGINYFNSTNATPNAMAFLTAGTERMRIDSSGNVGIGTSSPLNKLDVRAASAVIGNYQTIQAFSTDSAAVDLGGGIGLGGFYSGTSSIAVFGNIVGRKENGTGGNYAGYLAFGTNAQATGVVERMRLDSSGNLLVGTTTAITGSNHVVVGTNSIQGFRQIFTNLGTTAQSFGFQATNAGVYVCNMKSIGGASVAFLITAVFNNSGIDMFTTSLGNCNAGGNSATISGINNDARTYTFTRNGGDGLFYVSASSTATGNTTFYITPLNVFA